MGTIRMTVKAIDWTQGDVGHVSVALRGGSCRIDWGDGASSVLEIEDDAYYGSDFTRMIVLLAIVDRDYKCYDEIGQVNLSPRLVDGKVVSDDDIINDLDDGTTWAEAWLRHPKLDHLVICHAVHDICTHKNYSVPDLLRMNRLYR